MWGLFYFCRIFFPNFVPVPAVLIVLYKNNQMKEFLLLLREDLETYKGLSPEEMQKDIENHVKWVEQLSKNGNFKHGNPLSPVGKFLAGEKKILTDGPFIEGKEGVSGFYFLLANSLEEAAELAKGCPTLSGGGKVEIREVFNVDNGQ
jgi:hypothetical protein